MSFGTVDCRRGEDDATFKSTQRDPLSLKKHTPTREYRGPLSFTPRTSPIPIRKRGKMSVSNDPGHFFQTDASESTRARRAAKSGNKNGNPIVLQSKILSAIADPLSSHSIYIAESAGSVRRVNIEVGTITRNLK